MCGIAGILQKNGIPDRAAMEGMLDCIRHRGPDGQGIFEDGNVLFGHRRLAIIDLTDSGAQPMTLQNRYTVTYNGELYNYPELKEELLAMGYAFISTSDTEVLLSAYAAWGADCVKRFNGMWAFALYDSVAKTVFCSRDRFGVKPFYYCEDGTAFRFGSEIKQLLPFLPKPILADTGMLRAYIATGEHDYSEATLFRDVRQLPGGCNLTYGLDTGTFSVQRWYNLNDVRRKTGDYRQEKVRFQQSFERAVRYRLRSDVPVGGTLSGGMDSSAIVCQAHEILKKREKKAPQYTVSSCFEEEKFDEQPYIDAVVRHTGVTSYKVFPPVQADFSLLDTILWYMDEPVTGVGGWTVYQEARKRGLTVMLVGEGADEYLAGYTPFFEALFIQLFKRGKWGAMLREMKAYQKVRAPFDSVSMAHLIQVTAADILLPGKLRDWVRVRRKAYAPGRLLTEETVSDTETRRVRNFYNGREPGEMTRAFLLREMPRILHCLDRLSMAFSVETRAPFLDVDLLEETYSMPLSYRIGDGVTKRIMRDALSTILPKEVMERHGKLGFVSPEFQWFYQNPDAVEAELAKAAEKLKGIVNGEELLQWCASHRGKQPSMSSEEWLIVRIYLVSRWMELFCVEVAA